MTTPQNGLDEELGRLYQGARFGDAGARYRELPRELMDRPANLFVAASASIRLGDIAAGSDQVERALAGFHCAGDQVGIMCATNLMGAIDFERGRIDRATHLFETARAIASRLNDPAMIARTNNNLANVAHLKGQISRSLHLYRRALTALTAANDQAGAAETWHNIALRLRQVGALRDAAHAIERSLELAAHAGRPGLLSLCQLGRADLRIEREDFEGARFDLIEAESLARDSGDPFLILEGGRLRALLSLRTGVLADAIVEATLLVAAAAHHQSTLLGIEGTAILALALKAAGDKVTAERERNAAVAGFVRLGAADLLEQFEIDWDEELGPLPKLEPSTP